MVLRESPRPPKEPWPQGAGSGLVGSKHRSSSSTYCCGLETRWVVILNGSLGRSTTCKVGKSIFRVSVPVRTKCCPFPWWTWFSVVNLLPGGWLITVGNDAISRAKCLFLLLADWALIIGRRHISLVGMSMLLGPCIISATMATVLSVIQALVFSSSGN